MSTATSDLTETDRSGGLDARDALPNCAARLSELLKAVATDGAAGGALLALLAGMAAEVDQLALELLADGIGQPVT